jgi:hypothetical protein
MSRTTEIVISTSHPQDDPLQSIRALLRMTGAERAFIASRTVSESREFEAYSAFVRGEAEDSDEERIHVGSRVPADQIPSLYRDGTCLILDLSYCPLSESLWAAIEASIPADDLGEFFLSRVHLQVGEHDVFDVDYSSDEVTYLGRYTVTLKLEASGTPTAPEAVRNQILALNEFREILTRFEKEFGPAQVAFLYIV